MLNTSIVQGNLVVAPEIEMCGMNKDIARLRFTVASTRSYAAKGQERKTDFIDCVAWRSTAEFIAKNFQKGQSILVQGTIQTEIGTDKEGNKRKYTTLNVENVNFCGYKNDSAQNGGAASAPAEQAAPAASGGGIGDDEYVIDDNEDLPF